MSEPAVLFRDGWVDSGGVEVRFDSYTSVSSLALYMAATVLDQAKNLSDTYTPSSSVCDVFLENDLAVMPESSAVKHCGGLEEMVRFIYGLVKSMCLGKVENNFSKEEALLLAKALATWQQKSEELEENERSIKGSTWGAHFSRMRWDYYNEQFLGTYPG